MARKPALYPRKNAGVYLSRPLIAALRYMNPTMGVSDPVEAIVGRWVRDRAASLPEDLQPHVLAMDLPGATGLAPIKGDPALVKQVHMKGKAGTCPACADWDYNDDALVLNSCPVCDGERTIASRSRIILDNNLERGAAASKAYREQKAQEDADALARVQADNAEAARVRAERFGDPLAVADTDQNKPLGTFLVVYFNAKMERLHSVTLGHVPLDETDTLDQLVTLHRPVGVVAHIHRERLDPGTTPNQAQE